MNVFTCSLPLSAMRFLLVITALVAQSTASILQYRQSTSSSSPSLLGISVNITSATDSGIPPAFETLLYLPEPINQSNLTDRSLNKRDFLGGRPINFCESRTSEFRRSKCNHAGDILSLRRYDVTCYVTTVTPSSRRMRLMVEQGSCEANEVCVDGPLDPRGAPTVASCVRRSAYRPVWNYNIPKNMWDLHIKNLRANAMVSSKDGKKALSVSSLEIDAGTAGSGTGEENSIPTTQQKCRNCVQLTTDKFAEGTDFLDTQVKIAAGAAATGILWLALLSG